MTSGVDPGRTPVKILLVDDRSENLLVLEKVLASPDRELHSVRSGNEALKLLLIHDFAVVLLDVEMPDMDGYETAQLMRVDPRSRAVPIIFVTAGARDDERMFRGYDVGAVDFIYKPINPRILAGKVDVFETLHRRAEEVRALNAALEKTQVTLEEKLEALENVNRTLSHDLRAPLRSINAFAEILAAEYAGRLDAEADAHLDRIVRGSRRMSQMLDDLFALLQLGGRGAPAEPVESEAIVHGVLDDLTVDIAGAGATVTVEPPLPVVQAHAGLLTQIFQNLIGNALKYRRAEAPLIRVGAARQGEEWRFDVKDNGVGIEPEKREVIFGVFQRLAGASVPGTGVGLALVKKAVERQGGRIWVESEPGRGSTFSFTLPA